MKQRISILLLVSILTLFPISCSKQSQIEPTITPNTEGSGQPCGNPFYPLQAGNQWIYQFNYEGQTAAQTEFTVAETTEPSITLNSLNYDTGTISNSTIQCSNGEIIEYPIIELEAVLGYLAGDVSIKHVTGIFMPSENGLMDAGWQLDWKTSFTADGEISANADGETFRATFQSSPLDMDWKIVGTGGSLTVPAGNFENVVQLERSIKIEVDSLQAVVRGQHVNVSTTLNLLTEMYYAPGVGLLKEEFTSASVRLFGMNFPISGSGSMELISYRIN